MPITSDLYFTESDYKRLCVLLDQAVGTADPRLRADLGRLSDELSSAKIVAAENIPSDVVTINSRIVVEDLDDGDEDTWHLSLPNEASVSNQRLSVLCPLGIALLGARVGETVEWSTKETHGQVRVKEILYQPEADGRYDL